MPTSDEIIIESNAVTIKTLLGNKFGIDRFQREYVWERKQIEDLIIDLSNEFLSNWSEGDTRKSFSTYKPYYLGEIVLWTRGDGGYNIIDGQQRITTLTLLLIYIMRKFEGNSAEKLPSGLESLVFNDDSGEPDLNLCVPERQECMMALLAGEDYEIKETDTPSVKNLLDRYADIEECWNDRINASNVAIFANWLMMRVKVSQVWTNNDDFAYVVFETMNDRGLSLTQVEMLRTFILSKVDDDKIDEAADILDAVVARLTSIKLTSKSKAEFEFFKSFFRGHYAVDLSQSSSDSDFVMIGKAFHRWFRDRSEKLLGLSSSNDYMEFVHRIDWFSKVYKKIYDLIAERNAERFLYLIVNADYGFTLQPVLILSSVNYGDSDEVVLHKIDIVSKYLAKVLTWRVWNHAMISQSSMEASIYNLCQQVRGMSSDDLETHLSSDPIEIPTLDVPPILNQQNKNRLRVLLALVTAIVAKESEEPDYILNQKNIEVEHIWSDHYDQHMDEFSDEASFSEARNNIGDLLLLPKSFNASYGDAEYAVKVEQYYKQNILAQTLNRLIESGNPGFGRFKRRSGIEFKPYDEFKHASILERARLYRSILEWNWQ